MSCRFISTARRWPAALGSATGCRWIVARTGDRGGASVWLLAVGLLLVAAGIAGAAVGSARMANRQAQVAADFGALAGAARVMDGVPAACSRAAEIVAANHGRLTGCRVDGLDVTVAVRVTASPLPGLVRTARAIARAGPVRAEAEPPDLDAEAASSGVDAEAESPSVDAEASWSWRAGEVDGHAWVMRQRPAGAGRWKTVTCRRCGDGTESPRATGVVATSTGAVLGDRDQQVAVEKIHLRPSGGS